MTYYAEPEASGGSPDYSKALAGLRDRVFLSSEKHQAQHWRANRAGADPDILGFEKGFVRRMSKLGIPFFAHCVVRDAASQLEMFRNGLSKDSPDDGIWSHKGYAVDLVHGTKAWDLTRKQWDLVGHIGHEVAHSLGIEVQWGGKFASLYDPAHWEIKNWQTRIRCSHIGRRAAGRCPGCKRLDRLT